MTDDKHDRNMERELELVTYSDAEEERVQGKVWFARRSCSSIEEVREKLARKSIYSDASFALPNLRTIAFSLCYVLYVNRQD